LPNKISKKNKKYKVKCGAGKESKQGGAIERKAVWREDEKYKGGGLRVWCRTFGL